MKKLLAITTLMLSTSAFAGFTGNNQAQGSFNDGKTVAQITTVQQALNAKEDDTPVTLTGYIVSRIGNDDDEFLFRDNTGEIKIDVEDRAWNGQNISPNDKVTISGKVDAERFEKNSVDVYNIQKQ